MNHGKPLKFFLLRLLGQEKRSAERHVLPGLVAYYWNGGPPVPRDVRDISLSGLYLLTADRWYPGTVIQMTIQETEHTEVDSERWIAIQAKVVRQETDGVGLAFIARKPGEIAEMVTRAP
ncbi:MAG TPA: PilZ domain-containing protein [Acidobacteriaceae bacterium]|nr:PilZ domain-containing protein [Acidobacteriaceae bacterium]